MKLLTFSDIHGDRTALERLMQIDADYYFGAGDLSNFARGLDKLAPILKPRADRLYLIPGNHESAADNARFCEEHGFHDFHDKSIQVGRWTIGGLGYSNITPFNTPGEFSEVQFTSHLAQFSGVAPLVMVCHCPPKDCALDRAGEGKHFGSPAMRQFIDVHQPAHFFCGHIHEAAGVSETIGATHGRNVGKQGYLLTLD